MSNSPFQNCIRYTVILLFLFGGLPSLFSQEPSGATKEEPVLSEMQRLARLYRAQGLQFQKMGDLKGALELYQKAVELDPDYAVPYNDVGIIYEAGGMLDRAEESYLKAVNISPNYLSVYSNLALLYENKRQLEKAAFYWEKRVKMGSTDDRWTKKARQRLEDIRSVLSNSPLGDLKERQVIDLIKDVENKKALVSKGNKDLALLYFDKARLNYQKGDELTAYKQALDALQLDSSNTEITDFIDKIQTRLLTK